MSPDVTVVIPSYDAETTIGRALASAVGQVGVDHEVIVVDDASRDGTVAAIQHHAGSQNVHLLRHTQNRGGGAARNTGAAHSDSRWLAFLDADDEWRPQRLQTALRSLEASGLEFAIAGFEWAQPERDGSRWVTPRLPPELPPAELLASPPLGAGSTLIVDRNLFWRVGGFDPALPRHQDWDLVLRLAEQTRGFVVEDHLVRKHRTQRPAYHSVATAKEMFLEKHARSIERIPPPDRRRIRAEHELDLARYAHYEGDRRRTLFHLARTLRWSPHTLFTWAASRGRSAPPTS